LWGGFSVNEPTLKRFFVLHYLLPLLLVAISAVHVLILHITGSTNPFSICSRIDSVRFYPKFVIKDIFGFFLIVGSLALMTVFWFPNFLGDSDNYIKANSLVTPKHIVPEWYFLPFYAILRAIPNKLAGVVFMFLAIKIMFWLPYLGEFKTISPKIIELSQLLFWCFIVNLLLLTYLGACVVEQPFVILSQISAIFYFMYFLFFIPLLSSIEKRAMPICY
jgi:ubiquinol-cytochrome c reductase cytochrome b subunit